ncbi:hypothetical protein M8J75_015483 [Diaphorina citri]|nr:hypothetical protein M8J75_015483 [Diaphorina citri]
MDVLGMTALVNLVILTLLLDPATSIFFDDEEPHVSKIRIHVFQPPPKIKAPKVVKHVHFNIHKPKAHHEEVHHPHEITIPITITPNVYPEIHHSLPEHQYQPGFSQGYAQGYSQSVGGYGLPTASHQLPQAGQYELPQYTDTQYSQPQGQLPDYGQSAAGGYPGVRLVDEVPYEMAAYGDYNPAGPTASGTAAGAMYPQPFSGPSANGGDYKSPYDSPAYEEVKYPWK